VNMIGLVCSTAADALGDTPAAPLKALANIVAEACSATVVSQTR